MKCSKCGAEMELHTVTETKHRSIFTILIYIILLFIPIIGWIALFKILGGSHKQKGVTYAICPQCGRKRKI